MDTTICTHSAFHDEPLTLDKVLAAVEKVKALQPPDQWILIDPRGNMYQGKVDALVAHLMQFHPLLKPPSLSDLLKYKGD